MAGMFAETEPTLSLYLLNESLQIYRSLGQQGVQQEILLALAKVETQLGNRQAALKEIARVGERNVTLNDSLERRRVKVELKIVRCQVLSLPSSKCIPDLTDALDFYKAHEEIRLPEIYRLRAKYYGLIGNTSAQEKDLLEAVKLYEKWSDHTFSEPLLRVREIASVIDEIMKLRLDKHNYRQALNIEERSRSITLRENGRPLRDSDIRRTIIGYGGVNLRAFSPREFLNAMPKSSTLIEYQVKGEDIIAWIYKGRTVSHVKLAVKRQKLAEHVSYSSSENIRRIDSRFSSPELSEWLLRPLQSLLPIAGDLLFLNDPILDRVDFSKLLHPKTLRPLLQDFGIAILNKAKTETTLNGKLSSALSLLRESLGGKYTQATDKSRRSYHSTDSILHALPKGIVLIEYAFSGDRLGLWIITKERIEFYSTPTSRGKIIEMVRNLRRSIQIKHSAEQRRIAAELYNSLLLSRLPRQERELVIVPDEILLNVPFALLNDPYSGRVLGEDYSIAISPSTSLYLDLRERQLPSSAHSRWTVLAVSNPVSGESQRPSWLPNAAAEVSNLMKMFPGSESISGAAAQPNPGYPITGQHEIVHFAGHWDPAHRFYDGTLQADSLPIDDRVRLVVLSACRTVDADFRHKENDFGLAEPLLAKGVPAVLVSLWDVDDSSTSRLLARFYEHFRSGEDGATALKSAQLYFLHNQDSSLRDPSKWAGFQLIGFGGI
jgi:CHAT domain-containing protein